MYPIIFIKQFPEYLVTIHADGVVAINHWANRPDGKGLPFLLEFDKTLISPKPREMYLLFPEDIPSVSSCFALSSDGKLIIHSGFWDTSLQLTTLSNGQTFYTVSEHGDVITCLDMGSDGKTIVTGSTDTSVRIWYDCGDDNKSKWNIAKKKNSSAPIRLKETLIGHDDTVTSVSLSTDLGLIVSSSKDKTVMQVINVKNTLLKKSSIVHKENICELYSIRIL